MGNKRPVHVSVKLGGKIRTVEQMIRRFTKLCKEEGILKDVKNRAYFMSKNQKNRRKKHAAKMRHLKKSKKDHK